MYYSLKLHFTPSAVTLALILVNDYSLTSTLSLSLSFRQYIKCSKQVFLALRFYVLTIYSVICIVYNALHGDVHCCVLSAVTLKMMMMMMVMMLMMDVDRRCCAASICLTSSKRAGCTVDLAERRTPRPDWPSSFRSTFRRSDAPRQVPASSQSSPTPTDAVSYGSPFRSVQISPSMKCPSKWIQPRGR